MSKNVAVFIDVANVFYAAKAAGVDIDYVTLLRAAVAGRDFVRAYAYTGLDPENDNQRQFQAFLARNGYKVVTKDIRKYGDGKVKANLDIELVVDMMKTARNLDVAVVVSGDGDFAPAIRAVQEMGVRVEVISFRGNTSSDLIDVADSFTDITQIAKVERGSSRSGRRVAAEADLSMTEVPEKETEGSAARRRRRTHEESRRRPAAATPVPTPAGANVTVLPGERLSRVGTHAAPDEEAEELERAAEAAGEEAEVELGAAEVGGEANGRRRRRRRGGRGRGRGRGPEGQAVPHGPGREEPEGEEEEELAPEPPRLPVHSTFGSVWDSQLGMPSAPLSASGELEEDLLDEEPEIPEYLLAEQRRRGGRGRGRGRGRASAYQQAVDRERFGRSGMGPAPSLGRREQRERVTRVPRERPMRQPREPQPGGRVTPSDEPWSEVPPEVEELLRAELARRGGTPSGAHPVVQPASEATGFEAAPVAGLPAPEPVSRAGRPRRRVSATVGPEAAGASGGGIAATGEPPSQAAATPRRRGRAAAGAGAGQVAASAAAAGPAREVAESRPAAPARRGRRAAAAAAPAEAAGAEEAATKAPATRRRRAAATADAEPTAGAGVASEAPPAAVRRSRSRTRAASVDAAAGASDVDAAPAESSAPARRRTRRKTGADTPE